MLFSFQIDQLQQQGMGLYDQARQTGMGAFNQMRQQGMDAFGQVQNMGQQGLQQVSGNLFFLSFGIQRTGVCPAAVISLQVCFSINQGHPTPTFDRYLFGGG